ncbi:MAG TPA: metal-sensitive transcriptional regulator [Thermomicrobiales bacterium]|jgi:DNA-binding FrmR family transcriptional regulator|nr:transcriptional regulator [Chloroflexota bacterium]HCG30680.1 transcriptional regulator [Chloroflexota bacterium]HQX62893.1 metal-sensitive transcriptional regulator [Thermomicrobiales bacterium]HQZ91119.1 metal-sensitive transcriptional regulator [Thermomicrobiales bacterium]HRA30524.1 metal-sensitive transcriptional regulator [Thermomicrobiales bacterium]
MPSIDRLDADIREDMIQRLKRIEGQARGIQKMIDEGRDCSDVMTQISAMRSASHSLSTELLEEFALHCLRNPDEYPSPEKAVAQMVSMVSRLTR